MRNAIITLGDIDDSGKGRHFKSRFIQAGVAGYPEQFGNVLIKKETLDKFINTIVGAPVIINHKDLTKDNADSERVGVVSNVWFDERDGWYWCDGIIWNEEAQKLIESGWSVSCSYDVKLADDKGGSENNIPYDIEFLDGVFTHLALVNNPRYERANIVFNSKTVIQNFNPNHDEEGKFCKGNGGKSFKEQIKDVEDGKTSDKTLLNVLDKPSQVWIDSGLPDKPIVMSAGVYRKVTEKKHQVDKETIEKLPELIQEPLYIFKSSTQQGSFVGVLNAIENKDKSDGPLIVAIKPSQEGLEVNIITSTYGKDKDFVNRELNKGNLIYENKKTGVSNRKASIALKVNNLPSNIINDSNKNFNPNHEEMLSINNDKEQDMALIDELKRLITKAENSKGDEMDEKEKEIQNEKVDKRKLIDEVGGILKGKVDEETWRTVIGIIEKIGYNESEAGTANNKAKNEAEDNKDEKADNKKVKNEDKKDKDEVKDLEDDMKKDSDNCKVENSKPDYFAKMNEIYNSQTSDVQEKDYISRDEKLKAAQEYFG